MIYTPLLPFHIRTRIAAIAHVDVKTVTRALRGKPCRASSLERINAAVAHLDAIGVLPKGVDE